MPPTLQDLQSRHRVYDLVHPCALKFHPNASFQIAEDLLASSQRAGPIISGISDMYSAHICCIDMHMDSNVGAHMCTCRNMFIRSLSAGCDFGTYIITASATISGKVTSKKENTNNNEQPEQPAEGPWQRPSNIYRCAYSRKVIDDLPPNTEVVESFRTHDKSCPLYHWIGLDWFKGTF